MATTSYINFVLRRYISKTAARLGGASKGHGDGHGEGIYYFISINSSEENMLPFDML